MPEPLQQVLAPGNWPTFAFILTRVGGFMLTAPLWSMSGIQRAPRAAVAVVLSIMLLPLAPRVALPEQLLLLPLPLGIELLIGMVIGLTAAVIVQGVALAGETLALQMGLSLGPAVSPMSDVMVPGIGQIKSILALLIYVSVGGHLMLLRGLADSLTVLPPGMWINLESGVALGADLVGTLFSTALRAAAPAMVTLLLIHAAVAITGRAVPQLNAILVAFPLTIGVGLLMIGVSLPVVATVITRWMGDIPAKIAYAIQGFQTSPWGL
jgi:flagellar biosynthetic protein FliR